MERLRYEELKYWRGSYLNRGSEAYVTQNGFYVCKEFWDRFLPEDLQRKERKLIELEQIPQLQPYYPKVMYLVGHPSKDYIIAYIMEYIEMTKKELDIKTRLEILRKLKDILGKFRDYGYLYLDIRRPNIIINKDNNPILIDIDNIKWLDRPGMDCVPSDMQTYMECGGKLDINAQILMYNKYARFMLDLEVPIDDGEIDFDEPFDANKDEPLYKNDELILDETGERILDDLHNRPPVPGLVAEQEYLDEHLKLKI